MFPWNIAKSAEAMFSRWAIKRVCKFLLKKKLGKFILGDVDLNQLDVQLSAGTVQLYDLALNVDYLNQKFGAAAPVMVKEGSIGSLLVTLPWRGEGCRIEVDELELVIAPYGGKMSIGGSETCNSSQNNSFPVNHDSGQLETDAANSGGVTVASVDVHEGVKTIAKMVKWMLSSFHVRIKKLIIAFDPCVMEEKSKKFSRTLVLRIAEVECGTCISEDSHLMNEAKDNFLGLSQLTNFVKFQGAMLEFLQIGDVENLKSCVCTSGSTFGERFSECSQSTAMTPIITGKNGGFSGHLKLSIPWKNGSLDIREVDADAYVEPLELRFQPSTVICFIYLWHIFEDMGAITGGQMLWKGTESVYDSAASDDTSSMPGPCSLNVDKVLAEKDSSMLNCSSLIKEEREPDALLSESHVISDWVGRSDKDRGYVEPDFGASVDQFFECFDELISSQSALGNSGIWNWTCSVFSAITAASNLASGSLHVPSVQQHVETNFKVTVAKISLIFSFFDEEPMHSCCGREKQAKAGACVHFLDLKFQDLLLILQACPEEMKFKATVQDIELDDHFSSENIEINPKFLSHSCSVNDSIQKLQDAVQEALVPFCLSAEDAGTVYRRGYDVDVQPNMDAMNTCSCSTCYEGCYVDNVVKVALLKTSGISFCQVTVRTGSSGSFVLGPMSFTLRLPPFILWANFGLVDKVSDILKEIGSCEMSIGRNFTSKVLVSNKKSSSQGNGGKSSCPHGSSISTNETLRGNISLTNARIILMEGYSSVDQIIALDFSSLPIFWDKKVEASEHVTSLRKEYLLERSRSLQLSWGDLAVYFITSDPDENGGTESSSEVKLKYSAHMIVSIRDGTNRLSTITMLWHDDALTGPWIKKRAKFLATAENLRNRDRFMGKDYEFASATTIKEMEDFDNHARQEIFLSSGFFLHALLSPVRINLGKVQYDGLAHLLHQLVDCLSCTASDTVNEESSLSQGSILVECDSVGIAVTMEEIATTKTSVQRELSGSWHSFKLEIQKFELLSVSNIGGVKGSSFIWMAHGEGNLLGFVTGFPDEELLLISCSNSTMGRADGEGSNNLSPRFSGTDIVHLWDPEDLHSYTSIAVRCGTIVAIGGRVDWWDAISSFFNVPSPEIEQASDNDLQKGGCEGNVPSRSSFVLNLIDVGVSYEPYLYDYAAHEGSNVETSFATASEAMDEQYFACLLAASSFRLSSASVSEPSVDEYNIRVQDFGLLLCPVTRPKTVGGNYSVEHLSKIGYVKVAEGAHVEALLRTYSKEDPMWEVESSDLHVVLNTCYDTTSGLIRLGAQLQQLFAPDVEDTLMHLQTRWNNVQGANEDAEIRNFHGDAGISDPTMQNIRTQSNPCISNLMDEICEDAFPLVGISDSQGEYHDKDLDMSVDDTIFGEPGNLSVSSGENFAGCFPFTGPIPVVGLESNGTSFKHEIIPEFIEEYFFADLRPLSELSLRDQSSNDGLRCESGCMGSGEVRIRNNGWYENTSLRILENHVSEVNNQTNPRQLEDCEVSSSCTEPDDYGKIKGRILCKNMNLVWRMYSGSDWNNFQKTLKYSTSERDSTVCLETSLSGMQIQYNIFPDGGICISRLSLSIQEFCLNDNSKNAPWKLVLGYYQSKDHPRKSSSKALKMDLESVRPDPLTPLEEYRLRVAFLPLHLHLHQNQLDFLINFFGGQSASVNSSKNATQQIHEVGREPKKPGNLGGQMIIEEALLPYFQKFDIWPVLIRVDYSPSHVDLAALRSGKYVELVNILPWKGVELQLKHVHSTGVYGWSSVCETAFGEWLEDISQNQVHKLLKGLPPIRSLVAVGSGATKLVTLPVKNYRKDRRLVKGVQRGTVAFLRSISLEAIGLGVHLAAGAHDILLQAEYMLTSIPPTVSCSLQSRVNMNVRSNQPKDARQGVKQAYESISDGLGKSASALVRTPLKRYQRGDGVGSALATAVQAVPVAAVAPASAAARAMHYALLGVRNSLDPEHKKESLDKYLGSTQQRKLM